MGKVADEADYGAFVPSVLDDYGLDVYEFRVYCRIVRRIGKEGSCYESIPSMAKSLKISQTKARDARDVLLAARLIRKEPRAGQSDDLYRTHHSSWAHPEELDFIRKQLQRKNRKTSRRRTPVRSDSGQPLSDLIPHPYQIVHPTPIRSDTPPLSDLIPKGTPIKGIPLRYSTQGAAPKAQKGEGDKKKAKQKKTSKPVSRPSYCPDVFESFWPQYRSFNADVSTVSPGDRKSAVEGWNYVFEQKNSIFFNDGRSLGELSDEKIAEVIMVGWKSFERFKRLEFGCRGVTTETCNCVYWLNRHKFLVAYEYWQGLISNGKDPERFVPATLKPREQVNSSAASSPEKSDFGVWFDWARKQGHVLASQSQDEGKDPIVCVAAYFDEIQQVHLPEHWLTYEDAKRLFPIPAGATV